MSADTGKVADAGKLGVEQTREELRRGVTVEVTPWGAFAAGALMVSSLALAFTLGRRAALHRSIEPNESRPPGTVRSLETVRRSLPLAYDELAVDRGTTADGSH